VIRNGVLENKDLKMLAPLLRLSGEGQVPMPPRTIDYRATATLVSTLLGQGGREGISGLPIPIRVTGGWDAPSYDVDWKSVFLEAAKDPTRVASMPKDLLQAATGLGIPFPGLPGVGTAKDILRVIPGVGGGATTPPPASPPPPQGGATQQPSQTQDPAKTLRGLFGR